VSAIESIFGRQLLADFARNENSSFQTLDVNALAGQNMRE
jgi:hypothetical protein